MFSKRIISAFSFISFLFLLLIARLYFLTQKPREQYVLKSNNSISVSVCKTRGTIYDRNLNPLVNSEKKYKICVVPTIESKLYLSSVLSNEDFLKIYDRFSSVKPFTFTSEKCIEETGDVKVYIITDRYSGNGFANHTIGYCDASFTKGISGIERAYNDVLNRYCGSLSLNYKQDAYGRILKKSEPTIQNDLYLSDGGVVLTIDKKIQEIAESASKKINQSGSVLITDVSSGEILASVSIPNYDVSCIEKSIKESDSSLLNRNLCAYNIGSTFKIVVSAAALSASINENFSHSCTGKLTLGTQDFYCHKKEGHGYVNLKTAFASSCNPYFIKLGQKVGKERIISMASAMGIGTQIKLCENIYTAKGSLPLSDEILSAGDLANISFGQGKLMATPVHIAKIISIVANGGYDVDMHIVKSLCDENKKEYDISGTKKLGRIINADVAKKICEYMCYTVKSGTGRSAAPTNLTAGGKTASAETGWTKNGEELVQAWFSGFYPAENPKFAIVVLSEGGNSGAASCAPVFKMICDELYAGGFCK